MAEFPLCSVDGCGKPAKVRGLCNPHYQRLLKHGDPIAGRMPQGNASLFFSEVVLPYRGEDCLIWPHGRDSDGYARMWKDGKAENPCRVVCEDEYGPPPTPTHQAAHSCGNGHLGCVARAHISWKTVAQNAQDKIRHGTVYRGGNKRKFATPQT